MLTDTPPGKIAHTRHLWHQTEDNFPPGKVGYINSVLAIKEYTSAHPLITGGSDITATEKDLGGLLPFVQSSCQSSAFEVSYLK